MDAIARMVGSHMKEPPLEGGSEPIGQRIDRGKSSLLSRHHFRSHGVRCDALKPLQSRYRPRSSIATTPSFRVRVTREGLGATPDREGKPPPHAPNGDREE
ncbi:hypothetical protein CRG98_013567 [Punica granatum]|uniref:Uncharacterized protein n=1 Tax=Punica granatum TaxID=22663 RepID=A0A2I0KC30_PUNGR|nr:hypothetical protein CRG98_013567 [Punica granatum]